MRGISVLALVLTLLLAACVHRPPAPESPAQHPAGSVPVPAGARPAPESSAVGAGSAPIAPGLSYRPSRPARPLADGAQLPAVQGLLAASDRAVRSHDFDLAAVNLERAQRLAPQSAVVYQHLADVRLHQGRPAEAEQLARKALAYSVSAAQQAVLWRQIAAARQQRGQAQAAQDALARAVTLENAASGLAP